MNRVFTFSGLILFCLVLMACSTNNEAIALDWKIADGEIVAYRTAMDPVETSTFTLNFDEIFSTSGIPDSIKQQFNNLSLPDTTDYISLLERNAHNIITVKVILDKVSPKVNAPDDELSQGLNQMVQNMVGTVLIRGELIPEGSIASFYLDRRQRNLLAIFFELPTQAVRVGDKWALETNCIEMGSGFAAEKAERKNQVEFSALSTTPDGKKIAILDYLIVESVEGNFYGATSTEGTHASMTCSFVGKGQFLIDEGRWNQLNIEFAINSTYLTIANDIQHLALTPLAEIPQQYIDMQ
ncbi:MAG: hypothetical protein R3E39_19140 [Anaerolineae bacterium]